MLEYWVVNLAGHVIERYSEPLDGNYARLVTVRPGEVVAPLAFPDVGNRLAELFPE